MTTALIDHCLAFYAVSPWTDPTRGKELLCRAMWCVHYDKVRAQLDADRRAIADAAAAMAGLPTTPELPTREGVQRYEPDGYYRESGEPVPCTCTPACPPACNGQCGCRACRMAFADFGYDE